MGFADITMILQTVLADSSGKLKHCGHMVQLHWGSSIPLMIDRLIQIPVPSNWCIDPYDLPKQPPTRNWDFSWPITVWTDIPCREKKTVRRFEENLSFPTPRSVPPDPKSWHFEGHLIGHDSDDSVIGSVFHHVFHHQTKCQVSLLGEGFPDSQTTSTYRYRFYWLTSWICSLILIKRPWKLPFRRSAPLWGEAGWFRQTKYLMVKHGWSCCQPKQWHCYRKPLKITMKLYGLIPPKWLIWWPL